jgi:very-short-patch-repair endonuclease
MAKPPLSENMKARSRELRNEPTEAEKKLWAHLRRVQLGAKFRRQHPLGPFILDFYCHGAKLAVEVDGGGHSEKEQAEYDAERTDALSAEGIRVLRFWNSEVMENIEGVLEKIREALE